MTKNRIYSRSFAWLLFVLILPAPGAVVEGPLIVNRQWPECTDLKTWTRDVMRIEGLEDATEVLQARAFFRWLRLFNRMATGGMIQAYEGAYGAEKYVTDAHGNGWLCDLDVDTDGDLAAQGCWRCEDMAFPTGGR